MEGISVVIPVYNEELNVPLLVSELVKVMSQTKRDYELIFVDDGSSDSTFDRLEEFSSKHPEISVIQFRRNFGQTAAMAAGLDASQYPIVVTMDGDLQNDPSEIPRMVDCLESGCDLVAGWRKDRQDKFLSRRLPSMAANWIISRATGVRLHDYGCTLKVMRREVAQGIRLYGEMHRFIPALAAEVGAEIRELPVRHRARKFGKSKYGISRTIRVVLDLITVKFLLGYSKRPIHLFGSIGLGCGVLGFLALSYTTIQRIFFDVPMGSRPVTLMGALFVMIGLQFLVFGLLAEVLARTYYESQRKPIYVVRKRIAPKQQTEESEATWSRQVVN